jgi:prevent-host-death family protein
MVHVDDIYSLTDFQRHAKEHMARLQQTGRPEVLTVNGKAVLVVQDAAAYQKLLDLIDRLEAIEGIRQGLETMHRGEGRPAADVFQDLRTKHHISHDA